MWPFTKADASRVPHRRIDDNFAVTGQLQPAQMQAVADAGFKAVICARPDGEEPGQPSFKQVAEAARAAGLAVAHIPVSGQLSEGGLIRMQQALVDMPRPILGYCRSGARAGSLYAAVSR